MASGFWRGETRNLAFGLTAGVLIFVLFNLVAALAVNRWNKYFFDALEQKNLSAVTTGIGLIVVLAVFSAAVSVGLVHMRMRLQLRWRQWLTSRLIDRWLGERRFYQLNIVKDRVANPEFRIADDVRLAIEPLVDFLIGLLNALLAAVAFISVLWTVGGALSIWGVTIPGYMVFAAIIYSTLMSGSIGLLGGRLVGAVSDKNAGEAKLRYELTRVREQAENIALVGGDEDEKTQLRRTFQSLAGEWLRVIRQQGNMTWILNGNVVLAPAIPLILGAPKYLSGEMSLGTLMQAATAFAQVQIALNWIVDNAIRLAEWFASARRVNELTSALDSLDSTLRAHGQDNTIVLGWSPDEAFHLRNVSVVQPGGGAVMIADTNATLMPGEKVIVKGASGSGKSTLIRAMAGLWPWGSGEILRPKGARMTFMPQRPYIPLGSLRRALLYPNPEREVSDEVIRGVLGRTGLEHFSGRLDEEEQWSSLLSGGEQQRLAFARVLLDPPDLLIMDEATSALDEISQGHVFDLITQELAGTTVINVAHRPGIDHYHDRELNLLRSEGGPAVAAGRSFSRSGRWAQKVWSRLGGR